MKTWKPISHSLSTWMWHRRLAGSSLQAGRRCPRGFWDRRLTTLCLLLLLTVLPGGCKRAETAVTNVDVFGSAGLGPGEFRYPRAIAVSPVDGCVFVVDKTARIQRFSPDGRFEHLWHMPEYKNGKPTGLYVDRRNRLWVADTHYARIICFDRDGRELFRFGSRGEGPGQFIFPTAVVVDRDGTIYVGEYGGNDRISKFSPDRKYMFSFADKSSGEGWVDRPAEILIDNQDVLWVADACHHRICRYDRDGKYLSSFAIGGRTTDTLSYPYGMAFETTGSLLVADRGKNQIMRFDREGHLQGKWGTQGRRIGQLLQPWGVAVGLGNRIYCLDSWNNRIQVINW